MDLLFKTIAPPVELLWAHAGERSTGDAHCLLIDTRSVVDDCLDGVQVLLCIRPGIFCQGRSIRFDLGATGIELDALGVRAPGDEVAPLIQAFGVSSGGGACDLDPIFLRIGAFARCDRKRRRGVESEIVGQSVGADGVIRERSFPSPKIADV